MMTSTYPTEIEEHAARLLAILRSWGGGSNCHDLEELIRNGFDIDLSGSHWDQPEHKVVLALEYIEDGQGHSGRYRRICAGMTAELLASIPELEPAKPWDSYQASDVPFSERSYMTNLFRFAASIGKDPALFESLYNLIENPQLKAEKGGVALLTHLIPSLIATQTDRRFQPIWDDMLNKRPTVFNGYFTGSFYDGFRGLCGLPPLEGDTDGVPADILPYAFDTLVRMIEQEPPYSGSRSKSARAGDNATRFNRQLELIYYRFEKDLGSVLQPILDPAPAHWPTWAKELAHEIAKDRDYVPFLGGLGIVDSSKRADDELGF